MSFNFLGQIIGIFAIVVSLLIFQQNTAKKMVFLKFVADILWIGHFMLIGAYTGMLTTTLSLFREIFLINREKNQYLEKKRFLVIFCLFYVVAAVFTWKNIYSFFPAMASIVATWAFWHKNTKSVCKYSFISSVAMFIYGISNHSVAAVFNEIITMSSIIIGYIRSKKRKGRVEC